ncbi:MAG TPA: hypothetical protein VNN08_23465 [Thermoanaerobaculia bacterium]|nr:hypothetical protein [Thermoanaerobaculia bacterium]
MPNQYRRRNILIALATGIVLNLALSWVAYGWENSTGLTWSHSYKSGRLGAPSTPEHLNSAHKIAVATTFVSVPALVLLFLLRDE